MTLYFHVTVTSYVGNISNSSSFNLNCSKKKGVFNPNSLVRCEDLFDLFHKLFQGLCLAIWHFWNLCIVLVTHNLPTSPRSSCKAFLNSAHEKRKLLPDEIFQRFGHSNLKYQLALLAQHFQHARFAFKTFLWAWVCKRFRSPEFRFECQVQTEPKRNSKQNSLWTLWASPGFYLKELPNTPLKFSPD